MYVREFIFEFLLISNLLWKSRVGKYKIISKYILSLYIYILNFPVLLSAAFPRLHDRIINLIAGILITKTDDKK